ncbi:MAG: TonB family protein [Proteobacteria bacterium]|nr:TonB family protein [Pseudomonadota bacterium]
MPAPVSSPNSESPVSPPFSAAQSGPPGIRATENPGHPLASNAIAALATAGTGPAGVAALPLKQRCKVQVFPDFPKRAQEDDVEQGHVLVRLHLDARGQVSEVSILEARPAGYFEAAARKAALQWRCLPSEQANDTVRVPFEFSLK